MKQKRRVFFGVLGNPRVFALDPQINAVAEKNDFPEVNATVRWKSVSGFDVKIFGRDAGF